MVSVVIPTLNRRNLILEAIASVQAQSAGDFELIVIDDGSCDGTGEAIAALGDERIRYVWQPQHGPAAARNRGTRLARSEWIAFLDSDDLWKPRKLERQLEFHRAHPEFLLSQTEEIWIRDGVRVNPRHCHRKPSGDIFLPSLERCLVSPSAVMIRREVFEACGGFDESLTVCEDYDLWLRIALRFEVGLVPQALVIKRGGHSDQLSRQYWGMDRFRVASLVRLLSAEPLGETRLRAVVETIARKCTVLVQGARKRGKIEDAESYRRIAEWARTVVLQAVQPACRSRSA